MQKKLLALMVLAAITITALPKGLSAATPVLNGNPQDLKLLVVANRTQNTDWQNTSVSANANDEVAFQFYFHNDIVGSVATNTTLRLTFPTDFRSSISVGGRLSADNATNTVNDSVTVNSAVPQKLVVDTANIRWFPNRAQTPTIVPATNSGPGFVEFNMGNLQGCWEFQGYANFVAKLVPQAVNPDIRIEKEVRLAFHDDNDDNGFDDNGNDDDFDDNGTWSGSANADDNDEVEFRIRVRSMGDSPATNVRVREQMPAHLSVVSGSIKVNGSSHSSGDDLFSSGGLNLGTLAVSQTVEITFRARVDFNGTTQITIINRVFVRADNIVEIQAQAIVILKVIVIIEDEADLRIDKEVRNLDNGNNFQDLVDADDNDEVEFRIRVRSVGDERARNVRVRDDLPDFLDFIEDSIEVDGDNVSNDRLFESSGLNLGTLDRNEEVEITFRARVDFNNSGSRTITNRAFVRADGVAERQDDAQVRLDDDDDELFINKQVRNESRNENSFVDSTNAQIGETVRFSLRITNSGDSSLSNVRVRDVLPSGLDYVSGSTRVDGSSFSGDITRETINIGTLSRDRTKEITFDAIVRSNASGTLVNFGHARADGVNEISDTANVFVGQANILSFEKRVDNVTRPNGTSINNDAFVGDTLRYTLSVRNNTNSRLDNVRITDVLPSFTSFISLDQSGSFNASSNSIFWSRSSLGVNETFTVSYTVRVNSVPANNTIIRNTGLLQTNNTSDLNSNEVTTRVILGQVLGAVDAKTGPAGLAAQLLIITMITLAGLAAFYAYSTKKGNFGSMAANLKLAWARWTSK